MTDKAIMADPIQIASTPSPMPNRNAVANIGTWIRSHLGLLFKAVGEGLVAPLVAVPAALALAGQDEMVHAEILGRDLLAALSAAPIALAPQLPLSLPRDLKLGKFVLDPHTWFTVTGNRCDQS